MSTFDKALARLDVLEGLWSDDPADPGGLTFRGITKKNWDGWLRKRFGQGYQWPPTDAQVRIFYKEVWWDAYGLGGLPPPIAWELFKSGVNMGIKPARQILQRALWAATEREIAVDGVIGPQTQQALSEANPQAVAAAMKSETARWYDHLVTIKPELKKFHKGWIKRAYA